MPVNTQRKDYADLLPKWARLRDCFEGRDAVLAAASKYVPDLPGTDVAGNKAYRERGNFYNAVMRTVQGMTGSIFQKPPEVEFPEPFKEYLDDVTLTNVPFETFAVDASRETMLTGRFGVLVDMPSQKSQDMRPYLCGYRAEDIVNWRTESRGGDDVLTMVVLREVVEVPDEKDEFACKNAMQYRVVQLVENTCVQQVWRAKADNASEFAPVEDPVVAMRRGVPLPFIPFVFLGATHATPELEKPPLIDLADVNLGHWRNSVDYEYGLHLIALPTPWVAGSKATSADGKMKIGPSVVWELEVQGSAGMLEFTGSGLASLVAAMDEKKKQMASLGARLIEDAPTTSETASAVRMRHSGEHATLRTVAGAIELGLTLVLQVVAWWAGSAEKPADTEVGVELNKEYLNVRATPQEVQVALTALQAGEISYETWWHLLATGGWGREGIDAAAERKAILEGQTLRPEPALDLEFTPPEEKPVVTPPEKVIRDGDGNVRYRITG